MYNLSWHIEFENDTKITNLLFIDECQIEKSVFNLADRATIILPEASLNKVFNLQGHIKRGDEVRIYLGYNNELRNEFEGFVQEITTNEGSLKIICEDGLFLFRKSVKNVQLKPTSVKKIAQLLVSQIDKSYKVVCDFDLTYEKFTIYQATAYDVLMKLQEETKANIYFNTKNKELHIRAPYIEKFGEVIYSMQENIETSSLEYKSSEDRKVEVTIERVDLKGKVESITVGSTGGEKITRKVGTMSNAAIKIMAHTEWKNKMAPGYEGSFDAWLIPYTEPTYTAVIYDEDYPEKDGSYYVEAVTTNFSREGGVRTIQLGNKLS